MSQQAHKTFRRLVKEAKSNSAVYEVRGKHAALRLPDGRRVFFSATPSDRRACANLQAALRRAHVVA